MAEEDAPNEGGTKTDPQQGQTDSGAPDKDAGGQDKPQTDPAQQTDKTFTQAELERIIADRITRLEKKFIGHDDLKKKAAKFDELEAAKKSEVEKLTEANTALQVRLQGFEVAEIRRNAAVDAGLPAKYSKYITAADEAGALEQAKELAKDLKPTIDPKPADLKQGARPHTPAVESKDQLIRRMAGYDVG